MSKYFFAVSILFLPLVSTNLFSADRTNFIAPKCFEKHLKEAIKTNRERRELYASLTNGKSRSITRELIFAEKMGIILMAKSFDRKALNFQKKGLNIICDEMISKRPIPEFESIRMPTGEIPEKFIPVDGKKLAKTLRNALEKEGWSGVARETKNVLDVLAKRPSFNCLIRNDLANIYKTASMAPEHLKKAKELGIENPEKLSLKLFDRVVRILHFINNIDKRAFPLQKAGVPIICQDFPEARPEIIE